MKAHLPEAKFLLPLLREFEVSIVARFLSAQEKLTVFSLLSKSWHSLISKNYSWAAFPKRGPACLVSDYIHFFDSFTELGGVSVLDFPQ